MTKSLKAAFAAVAILVSVAPAATVAFASAGEKASCEASDLTQHGVWDCR